MSQTDSKTAHEIDPKAEAAENALAMKIILTVLVLIVLWGLAIFFFGVPGLYIPAVIATPIIYILLITVARGG
ncbi:hypothetical protein [Rhodalgimonas zhirmunskyi]|uniref:Uncharacterized protein n=1 Tax=Rhodalgimonas zhirmunskyi TaxID=2964767 RepID=A0AAJ1UC74_9RHOB|nr:hypothetical protein [Rhodoalgimonas zhirmunskyi]MDQ2093497.1 hypothetical protein [Rhodoalgimonas zhirmunskyi]